MWSKSADVFGAIIIVVIVMSHLRAPPHHHRYRSLALALVPVPGLALVPVRAGLGGVQGTSPPETGRSSRRVWMRPR